MFATQNRNIGMKRASITRPSRPTVGREEPSRYGIIAVESEGTSREGPMAEEGASSAFRKESTRQSRKYRVQSYWRSPIAADCHRPRVGGVASRTIRHHSVSKIMTGCVLTVNQNDTYQLGQSCTWRAFNIDGAKAKNGTPFSICI